MARKLRVEFPGAIYHLMSRENRREPIFKDDTDRERFVSTFGKAWTKRLKRLLERPRIARYY
jgi:hypothetical protein